MVKGEEVALRIINCYFNLSFTCEAPLLPFWHHTRCVIPSGARNLQS